MRSLDRIISFEGQLLATIDRAGPENVAAVSRDMIDAGANILCRLEGSREAAAFAFNLSDRMVGNVLGQPTEAPIYLPPIPAAMARPAHREPYGKASTFWQGYLIGVLAGVLLGLVTGRAL